MVFQGEEQTTVGSTLTEIQRSQYNAKIVAIYKNLLENLKETISTGKEEYIKGAIAEALAAKDEDANMNNYVTLILYDGSGYMGIAKSDKPDEAIDFINDLIKRCEENGEVSNIDKEYAQQLATKANEAALAALHQDKTFIDKCKENMEGAYETAKTTMAKVSNKVMDTIGDDKEHPGRLSILDVCFIALGVAAVGYGAYKAYDYFLGNDPEADVVILDEDLM